MRQIDVPPADAVRGKNHWQGRHRMAVYGAKQMWKHHAHLAARSSIAARGYLPGDPPFHIRTELPLTQPTRADGHNFTSYEVAWIIDGLVTARLIPDDSTDLLVVHDPTFYRRQRGSDPVAVTVSWIEPCPACDRPVDTGDPTVPAPWCSDGCAPVDEFARGDLEFDMDYERRMEVDA